MSERLHGRQAVVTSTGGPEVLEVRPFEVEGPGTGEVVVAVEAHRRLEAGGVEGRISLVVED